MHSHLKYGLTYILFLGFMLCKILLVYPQESITAAYNTGPILVHSQAVKDLVNTSVKGFTVNYAFPNKAGVKWRMVYNFPNYGLS